MQFDYLKLCSFLKGLRIAEMWYLYNVVLQMSQHFHLNKVLYLHMIIWVRMFLDEYLLQPATDGTSIKSVSFMMTGNIQNVYL